MERGIRGLSITDHDTLTMVSNPYEDLLVIPGMEIRIDAGGVWGDIIALGVTEEVPLHLGLRETVEEIHRRDGLAIVPHPFSQWEGYPALGDAVFEIRDIVDAIEVSNPRPFLDNARARKVAREFKVAKVGGSDAHKVEDVGRGLTKSPPAASIDELLDHIRRRRTDGINP
jgi:predicted metal-dependent phosphoesterase TrpH